MKTIVKQMIMVLCIAANMYGKGYSPHVVAFFFKNYPLIEEKDGIKKVPLENKNPKSGIFVSYFGYITTSDTAGEIMFPRKHQDPQFSLLICSNPEPVFMLQNTIHHWQVKDDAKFSFYSVERKKDDQTNLYFWEVKKDTLPDNKHLPVNTILIFAQPDEIYVPEGITLTNNNPQLILPSFYVKHTINAAKNAISALDIRTFFDPIDRTYKVSKDKTQSHTNAV